MADIGSFLNSFAQSFAASQQAKAQREQLKMQGDLIKAKIKADEIETQMKKQKADLLMQLLGGQAPTAPSTSVPQMIASQNFLGGISPANAPAPSPSIPMASTNPAANMGTDLDSLANTSRGQILLHSALGFTPKPAMPGPPIETSTGIYSFDPRQGGYVPITDAKGNILRPPSSDVELAASKTAEVEAAKNAEEKKKNLPKVRDTYLGLNRQWDTIENTIDEAIKMIGPFTAGPGSMLANVPGSPQKTLQQKLQTIRANIGFDKLQQMRNDSPTGGALGQVSDRENALLQAVQGSLEQSLSPDELKSNLETIKNNLEQVREEKATAFKTDYGFNPLSGKPSLKLNKKKSAEDEAAAYLNKRK